ncbi:MAG: hypothetical protein Q8940_19040 [Bacteroidota bacterium]|nr:hypothetical protein [Bacteroidota bacterium]
MFDNHSENPTSWLYSSHPTDDELFQIYSAQPTDDSLVKLFQDKAKQGNDLFVFRDEAFGMYWDRKLKSLSRKLTQEEISDILQYIQFPCAKGIIGEAAVKGLLSRKQCDKLVHHFESDNWAYVQLKARILVSDLDDSKNADDKRSYVLQVLEELIQLKRDLWAINKVLNYLTSDELLKFKERLTSDKSILNKGNRHFLEESIDKILKLKKSL